MTNSPLHPQEHELKCWSNSFDAIAERRKKFEWRLDDRGFEVGDVLVLKRWNNPLVMGHAAFNGYVDYNDESPRNTLRVRVTYILRGVFGVPANYCVMSVELIPNPKQPGARPHINDDGEFQSDKYPTTPPGKVPLSVKDPVAQPYLWRYASEHRSVDAEFSDDLEFALKQAGYQPPAETPEYLLGVAQEECKNGHTLLRAVVGDAVYDHKGPSLATWGEALKKVLRWQNPHAERANHGWEYQGLGRSVCSRCGSVFLGNTDERPVGPCYGPAKPAVAAVGDVACYCSEYASSGMPCSPGKCPNNPRNKPVPYLRCERCGREESAPFAVDDRCPSCGAVLREMGTLSEPLDEARGPKMFLGLPDRWYDGKKFRCAKGHISTTILKSEVKGDLCLECQTPALLTFPEDAGGGGIGAEVYALRWAAAVAGIRSEAHQRFLARLDESFCSAFPAGYETIRDWLKELRREIALREAEAK